MAQDSFIADSNTAITKVGESAIRFMMVDAEKSSIRIILHAEDWDERRLNPTLGGCSDDQANEIVCTASRQKCSKARATKPPN
jgi:hypothetical protein